MFKILIPKSAFKPALMVKNPKLLAHYCNTRHHVPGSVKVHLAYGRLTLADVKKACDALEKPTLAQWNTMSTPTLKLAHKEIVKELNFRKT